MDKEKEIISQANEITNSMSPLDLVQKRCFYLIVQQVRKDYIETENPKKGVQGYDHTHDPRKFSESQRRKAHHASL